MKRSLLFFATILLISSLTISCKKDDPNDGFSDEIKKIVPSEVITAMRKQGMNIYEGKTPPQIEGIYLMSENILTGSSLEADDIGKAYADYNYQFYEQDESTLSVKVNFKGYDSDGDLIDQASGMGSFISGNDNTFTVFTEENGVTDDGDTYTYLSIYSGEYTDTGVKNFQNAFYMKEKNDPNNNLVEVGTTRVFTDSDAISEKQSSLRVSAEKALRKTGELLRSKGAVGK